ncbi:hypothetical protein [Streptomyces mirabilis]
MARTEPRGNGTAFFSADFPLAALFFADCARLNASISALPDLFYGCPRAALAAFCARVCLTGGS